MGRSQVVALEDALPSWNTTPQISEDWRFGSISPVKNGPPKAQGIASMMTHFPLKTTKRARGIGQGRGDDAQVRGVIG